MTVSNQAITTRIHSRIDELKKYYDENCYDKSKNNEIMITVHRISELRDILEWIDQESDKILNVKDITDSERYERY